MGRLKEKEKEAAGLDRKKCVNIEEANVSINNQRLR